jgi:hypothetical protein
MMRFINYFRNFSWKLRRYFTYRMDYLQRDAYFTGVSYGAFDMERILRLMRPSKVSASICEEIIEMTNLL